MYKISDRNKRKQCWSHNTEQKTPDPDKNQPKHKYDMQKELKRKQNIYVPISTVYSQYSIVIVRHSKQSTHHMSHKHTYIALYIVNIITSPCGTNNSSGILSDITSETHRQTNS